MIPYRFSFLYCFVMLYMAYRAWLIRDSFKLWQFIVAGSLTLGVMMCADKRFTFIFLSYNLAILLLYLGTYIYKVVDLHIARKKADPLFPEVTQKRENAWKKYSTWALLGIMGLELALSVANFGVTFTATNVYNYPAQKEKTASAIRYMYEREKYSDFFRAEFTHSQTLNDSALNHFEGITTFTSSANVRITEFMGALGFSAKNTYNRYLFEEASPVSNLFLNLKYMIERDGEPANNPYFDTIHSYDDVYLLKNNAYLPLGFLAESTLADATIDYLLEDEEGNEEDNEFFKQNKLFSLATGLDGNVWNPVNGHCATVMGYDVTLDKVIKNSETTYTKYHTGDKAGTLRYTYTMRDSGFLCMEMNMSEENTYRVSVNGKELFEEQISLPQVAAIAYVENGDTVEIEIVCKSDVPEDEPGIINIRAALLDDDLFCQGYNILAASTWDLTEFSNTKVSGTINCNRDGLLYTSIPYDGNWVVEVDGKEADVVLVGDAMMALELTEGNHTITFRYENKAFTIGAIISAVSLVAFLGIIFVPKLIKKRET